MLKYTVKNTENIIDNKKQMFYDKTVECHGLWERFNTNWSAEMNLYATESKRTVPSYREELSGRELRRVDERCPGGAFGCPGDYFRGAPAADCRPIVKSRCNMCWGTAYQNEEWIEYETGESELL